MGGWRGARLEMGGTEIARGGRRAPWVKGGTRRGGVRTFAGSGRCAGIISATAGVGRDGRCRAGRSAGRGSAGQDGRTQPQAVGGGTNGFLFSKAVM
jgi:hypothetical protein